MEFFIVDQLWPYEKRTDWAIGHLSAIVASMFATRRQSFTPEDFMMPEPKEPPKPQSIQEVLEIMDRLQKTQAAYLTQKKPD